MHETLLAFHEPTLIQAIRKREKIEEQERQERPQEGRTGRYGPRAAQTHAGESRLHRENRRRLELIKF